MNTNTDFPAPQEFGFPVSKFPDWRENQVHAIENTLENEKRVTVLASPTGFGKSLVYMACGIINGGRTVILTSNKGLQSQLIRDFKSIGAVDVRGKNNYKCKLMEGNWRCDNAPCGYGYKCQYKDRGCHFYDALKAASNAEVVVTNYAFYLYSIKNGSPLVRNSFKTLICDEGHLLPDIVSDFLKAEISVNSKALKEWLPPKDQIRKMSVSQWKLFSEANKKELSEHIKFLSSKITKTHGGREVLKQLGALRKYQDALNTIATCEGQWEIDHGEFLVTFTPLWPSPYVERCLFKGSQNIIAVSATINEKTMTLLGLDPVEDCMFLNYPHTFPVESRWLTCVPTLQLNSRTTPEQFKYVVQRIDSIIGPRLDRRGIIHSVSYARRNEIIKHSRHRDLMLTHATKNIEEVIDDYIKGQPPVVLLSPSVTTGYDFPYDDCRYQILVKVPYPDTRSNIMKARCKDDKEYSPYIAMVTLQQMCGRGIRAKDDWCENFILDNTLNNWFLHKYRHFAQEWFLEAIRVSGLVGKPVSL